MRLPLVLMLLAAPAFAAPASPDADVERAFAAARASFLSHEAGAPTVDPSAVPPLGGRSQELKLILDSAREIQLGCVLPCASPEDALVYKGKVEMVSSMLGIPADKTSAAVSRYLPDGKPRLRKPGAPTAPPAGDKLIEGKVMERLLSDGRVAGQTRDRLSKKAVAFADALGRTQVIEDGGLPSGYGAFTASRGITPEQIKALNALPSAQASILKNLASKAPPSPVTEAKKDAPPEDGLIANSIAHWDRVGEDPNTSTAGRMGAATMVGLLKMFNLDGFENSAFKLSDSASDPTTSKMQVLRDAGSVGGNAALTVAGFLPAGAWTKLASVTKLDTAAAALGNAAKMFRANPAVAERVAALQQKALTSPLSREEAAWLGEHANDGSVIFHGTNAVDDIVKTGRVAATTERYVYGARQEVSTVFRQLKAGVLPKDQLVVFQGQAAKLFQSHEATGLYSGMKKLAGQMTTNGAGDIVITKFSYNAETKTLSILEARMVNETEEAFLLKKPGWYRTPSVKQWGRRLVLDPMATSAAGLVAVNAHAQANGENMFEYVLGSNELPPQTAGR